MSELHRYYRDNANQYEFKRFRRGGSLVHGIERNTLLSLLRISRNDSILDLGGGTGRFEKMVGSFPRSIISCDINKEMLDLAQGSTDRVCGNAFTLPFKDNSFDKCVALRFLFHFNDNDKQQILREIIRVTAKGGMIVFDLQSSTGLVNLISRLTNDRLNFPISQRSLREILDRLHVSGYDFRFLFLIPRGVYQYIPPRLARLILSFEKFVPHRRVISSAIFCRVIRN